MEKKIPILLSFYSLSSKSATLLFGQVTYTTLKDLSFKDYSRRRTFRTLVSLYRTKPYAEQSIVLVFDKEEVKAKTDGYGAFQIITPANLEQATLRQVMLLTGEEVRMIEGLYPRKVQQILTPLIVVSDIDDTLVHSFIYRKLKKFRTLMFTTMEKRKAVDNMQGLLRQFTAEGAASFYLSNSEQNLYPLIYRFLTHNEFPSGPLFLKKMRRLWDVIWNVKFPLRNIHKQETIRTLLTLFPDKKFILMGDNTQQDLVIYLEAAEKFPDNIRHIIIRKVVDRNEDHALLERHVEKLKARNINLYYSDKFPESFEIST